MRSTGGWLDKEQTNHGTQEEQSASAQDQGSGEEDQGGQWGEASEALGVRGGRAVLARECAGGKSTTEKKEPGSGIVVSQENHAFFGVAYRQAHSRRGSGSGVGTNLLPGSARVVGAADVWEDEERSLIP